jgi:hypothetical protein
MINLKFKITDINNKIIKTNFQLHFFYNKKAKFIAFFIIVKV